MAMGLREQLSSKQALRHRVLSVPPERETSGHREWHGRETMPQQRSIRLVFLLSTVYCLLSTLSSPASDWPQWRGPERTGVSKETGLLKSWPEQGPPLLWTYAETGVGYSGPAIVGEKVYI